MSPSLPRSVRNALGEEPAEDLELWLDLLLSERAVPRDEYRAVQSRLDGLENEVRHLRTDMEDGFEQVDRRFEEVDRRFEQVERRFVQIQEQFEVRFDQLNERFERRAEQVDERFEAIERRFDSVDHRFDKIDEQFARRDQRFDAMNANMMRMMRWTVGTIALFGTLITVLITVAEFF
jgi:chromosome segregation ATPase